MLLSPPAAASSASPALDSEGRVTFTRSDIAMLFTSAVTSSQHSSSRCVAAPLRTTTETELTPSNPHQRLSAAATQKLFLWQHLHSLASVLSNPAPSRHGLLPLLNSLTATTCPLFSDLWSYTYNAANRNAATIKFVTASPLANTLPLNCRERAAVNQKHYHS